MAKFNVGDKVRTGGNHPVAVIVQAVKDGGIYSVMTADGKRAFDVSESDLRSGPKREPKQ